MRVFVAGATGAIGRPLVPRLLAAGYGVTGTTRSEERAAALRTAGAEAAVLDALDRNAVLAAMEASRPEVVVHQLTALPERIDPGDPATYEPTSRLRSEGTRILLDAARATGARRFVAQSVAFLYAQVGGPVKTEDDPLLDRGASARAVAELEQAVTGAQALEGVVLRYGYFYGPGTYYGPEGSATADVRRGRFPIVGGGDGVFSFVHVDDAAEATVAAVERGAPGVYTLVDDEPAPMRDWLPAFAAAAGADPPPVREASPADAFTTGMRGASNAKAKGELGWEPRYPSWRIGFAESLS